MHIPQISCDFLSRFFTVPLNDIFVSGINKLIIGFIYLRKIIQFGIDKSVGTLAVHCIQIYIDLFSQISPHFFPPLFSARKVHEILRVILQLFDFLNYKISLKLVEKNEHVIECWKTLDNSPFLFSFFFPHYTNFVSFFSIVYIYIFCYGSNNI